MTREEEWLLEEGFGGEKSEGFFAASLRLRAGEPLAYLIGHTPFLGTTIYLDSHPLIPRAETEFWVEKAILEIRNTPKPRVLDLCAGSGCIGVAVQKLVPSAYVDFAEIDVHHHETIHKNIRENGIDASRTHVHGGDLFEEIHRQYDYILSNPPYIDTEAGTVDANVVAYEPHEALFGGRLGMEILKRIIAKAPTHLTKTGLLYIEHEPAQAEVIRELAETHGFEATNHPDQYGVLRYSILSRKNTWSVSQ